MKCSAVVESRHTHDFVWCNCRALAVDGGVEYVRWVFDDINLVEDLCEYAESAENNSNDK